jgi:hypothetical protein
MTTFELKDKLQGKKVAAFMTAPRYESTWARNMIETAMKQNGIPLVVSQGVFYGQCMQRMFIEALEAGVEIAITVDFDSIFNANDLQYLLALMTNEDYDAVAALQSRRGSKFPLFTLKDKVEAVFDGKPLQVDTAHFGLTAIRLQKLKDVPKPWFVSTPNEDGDWEDGKIDDDIHFWRQWTNAGNGIYVDAALRIGHLEEVIAMFDEEGNHKLIYPNDWFKENILQSMRQDEVQAEES